MNEFLVRCIENKSNHYIDLSNGQEFEKCDVPYKMANHGLCGILKRKVLKKLVNDSFEPLVFKSINTITPKLPKKGISLPYKNEDGLKSTWNFTPFEIMESIKGLNDDLNDRELAIMLFCPRDVVKKLRFKLTGGLIEKIMNEIGGDINGNRKRRTKIRVTTSNRTPYVRGISTISQGKCISRQGKL